MEKNLTFKKKDVSLQKILNKMKKTSKITRPAAHSTQHTAHSTQHTAHSTQHTAHSTQHTAHCNTVLKNHKNYLFGLFISLSILIFYGCPSPEIILSGENTLTAITVNDGKKDMVGNIAASHITFSDSAVAGTTQVTVKSIIVSDKASADANRNDTIPIKKTIAITAENGSIKYYAMSINVSTATITGDGMTTTDTGNGMTTTGDPVIGTITGARLAIAGITSSAAMISGSFTKQNNPILTELGILVTTDAMLNLELTSANQAPNGAMKLTATAEQLALINMPTPAIIPLSFTVPNLNAFTTYYFRAYAAISGGNVAYTDKINRMTLANKVSVSNFTIRLPYNVAGMNLDGLFRMNYAKDPSPIRSFGVLITSGNGILALNGENAPEGARLIRGNATAIAAATSANGTLSLSASNLTLETTYAFRGYVQNDAGITYTDVSMKTTPGIFTPIPDDNFRNAILSCINTNGTTTLDGQTNVNHFGCAESFNGMTTADGNRIRTDVLLSITQFNYGGYSSGTKPNNIKIGSISGVEQMVNLTRLNVQSNSLTSLDVSENTALTQLFASANFLSSLDLFENTVLTELELNTNCLTSFSSRSPALTSLVITRNSSLSSLDVSANTALTSLTAAYNSLSSLDVSANTALTTLSITYNSLSSLDISANTALTGLFVYHNSLSSLDVSANTALTQLHVYNNQLSSLDVSENTMLTQLQIYNNPDLTCIRANASQETSIGRGLLKNGSQTLSGSCL